MSKLSTSKTSKRAIERESLEATLRRVLREETAPYKVRGKGK